MDFETVYSYVEQCSHETAFNKEEARALYLLASSLGPSDNVVEIGVEFGRSTTILGFLAKEIGYDFLAIDPFVNSAAKDHVFNKHLDEWGLPIRLAIQKSSDVAYTYLNKITLLHIDGDHSYEAVLEDCRKWLPKVTIPGFVCFDDYGHPGLEEVKMAVDEYMGYGLEQWKDCGTFGNKLKVYKRIA